jgi:RNA polymerase sigma factor (sigma-70 family)
MERVPVVVRVAVTNENLMADSLRNDGKHLKENPILEEILYDRIVGIVRKLAFQYRKSTVNEVEDLVQDCIAKIWSSREQFNKDIASLSTWVWWVCRSVLNTDSKKSRRHRKTFKFISQKNDGENHVDVSEYFYSVTSGSDGDVGVAEVVGMKMAIENLYEQHGYDEKRKEVLDALFCIEEDGIFVASVHRATLRLMMPGQELPVKAPDNMKKEYIKKHGEVIRFVRNIVRPVFARHVGGDFHG